MSDKDKILIQVAWDMAPMQWPEILRLATYAESELTKKQLEEISRLKYRQEEASLGMQ